MAAKKGDFVELEFTGKNLGNNEIFDTNVPEEAKKLNPKAEPKPLQICIGQGMVVKGFDEALEGKEIGRKHKIQLSPEKAFGKRQSELVRLMPMKIFLAQKIRPEPGMTLALDDNLVRIVSVSGGRVLVDFNNPLAGKDVEYEFTIKKILADIKEKTSALQKFLFGQEFEFEVDEAKKKIIFKDSKLMNVLNVFKDKFKEMLGYEPEILQKKESAEDKAKKVEDKKPENN